MTATGTRVNRQAWVLPAEPEFPQYFVGNLRRKAETLGLNPDIDLDAITWIGPKRSFAVFGWPRARSAGRGRTARRTVTLQARSVVGPGAGELRRVRLGGGMTAAPEAGYSPVELTAHPLQRVGAFALAALAGVRGPGQIDEARAAGSGRPHHDHLRATTDLEDSKGPGGFWLGTSYLFWPNSALNPTSRGKLSVKERNERLRDWRTLPARTRESAFLARLSAAGLPRSSTAEWSEVYRWRPVQHTAIPRPAVMRALRCAGGAWRVFMRCRTGVRESTGGRAAVLHSWDGHFLPPRSRSRPLGCGGTLMWLLARSVSSARMRARSRRCGRSAAMTGSSQPGVELFVFSNTTRSRPLDQHHQMAQPLAEWLRHVSYDPRYATGWRYLNHPRQQQSPWPVDARTQPLRPASPGHLRGRQLPA